MNPKLSIFPRFERPRAFNRPKRGSLSHAFQLDKIPKNAIRLGSIGVEIQDCKSPIQTDVRYQEFLPRAVEKETLGYALRVAAVTDVLQGKVWAYLDKSRRRSKRQKDLADIMRLVEAHPTLENQLPPSIRQQFKE